jgi:hypothetical protein
MCAACLVTVRGASYCAGCKRLAIAGQPMPVLAESAKAAEAFKYSIVGIFLFGFILEPVAIYRAWEARRQMAADPTLGGRGKATAAVVIGFSAFFFSIVGLVQRCNAL